MRKLRRLVAKRHMKNNGMTRICSKHKHGYKMYGTGNKHDSFFSSHWRDFV